jgi:lipid A 3-O-deacylase
MKKFVLLLTVCVLAAFASAQDLPSASLQKGTWDLGLWAQGGHSIFGGVTVPTGIFSAGGRVGRILSSEHGSGILRGNFEYAVDFTPVTVVAQDNTVYGAGFSPIILRWNFTSGHKLAPWLEAGGGVLFTSSDVPSFTNSVNFTPQAAVGINIFLREKRSVDLAFKYLHISNAGLAVPNPGLNTLQGMIGFHWYK